MFKSLIPCQGENCTSHFIQNKKKHLCSNCVFKLNHGGKSQQEVYSERSKLKVKNLKIDLSKGIATADIIGSNPPARITLTGLVLESDEIINIENQNRTEEHEKRDFFNTLELEAFEKFNIKPNIIKTFPFKKKKQRPLKKTPSSKEAEIKRNLIKTYKHIDYTREKVCTGCNKYHGEVNLSHSHIISKADCKKIGKPELIWDEGNIVYHCFEKDRKSCHKKWESNILRKTLLDYEKNMEYIKSVSIEMYNKYLVK